MRDIGRTYRGSVFCKGHPLGVVDDFGDDWPISPAELDAVQAFLMPIIDAVMGGDPIPMRPGAAPSGKRKSVTHKRRNAAN